MCILCMLIFKVTWQSATSVREWARRQTGGLKVLRSSWDDGWNAICCYSNRVGLFLSVVDDKMCLCVLKNSGGGTEKSSQLAEALYCHSDFMPQAPLGSQGPNQNLALPTDLLTPAVSALIKTSSTQCGPCSCTLVHTIFALSTFITHAQMPTYATLHTVAHQTDPESLGGRKFVTFNLHD